jgi:hypothetical protein
MSNLNNNTTMRNYPELIEEFIFYVNSFYNEKDGIYPIATKERIAEAVNIYLESKPLGEIYFDSIDREFVRLILEPTYSL